MYVGVQYKYRKCVLTKPHWCPAWARGLFSSTHVPVQNLTHTICVRIKESFSCNRKHLGSICAFNSLRDALYHNLNSLLVFTVGTCFKSLFLHYSLNLFWCILLLFFFFYFCCCCEAYLFQKWFDLDVWMNACMLCKCTISAKQCDTQRGGRRRGAGVGNTCDLSYLLFPLRFAGVICAASSSHSHGGTKKPFILSQDFLHFSKSILIPPVAPARTD